ncbi:MAG: class I SAM-dependent methyltransferase [Deltaproteobacteria bacterium]|nr:class I SAM-dependent methyltransferase [Deltaproteobacteria bacterium]
MEQQLNPDKLNELLFKVVGDLGAAFSTSLVIIGDKLGLYSALAKSPSTPAELAKAAGVNARYAEEWLNQQAASGYVSYDKDKKKYYMTPEQAAAFADSSSPAYMPGAFEVAAATVHAEPKIAEKFRSGEGLPWKEHHNCLFNGTEKFFRANYVGNLVGGWLPALEGVTEKLTRGARVADIGCGHGASTILMAEAFPESDFTGFDYHEQSITTANNRARERGLSERLAFEVADATSFPGGDYDLIAHFDCFHDLGDPFGAAKRVKETLAKDGTWMIVEPFANDNAEDNHNPVGRVFYGASTSICVPCSLALNGPALGAQAGEQKLSQVIREAGFTRIRRAAETPFNIVLEVKH